MSKPKDGTNFTLHCAIFPKHQLDLPPIFDIKKRYNKRENTYCEYGNRICRHVTEPFFPSNSIMATILYILYCTAHYYCDHNNNFLWEPHMQISDMYFYWLSSSYRKSYWFQSILASNPIRFQILSLHILELD